MSESNDRTLQGQLQKFLHRGDWALKYSSEPKPLNEVINVKGKDHAASRGQRKHR